MLMRVLRCFTLYENFVCIEWVFEEDHGVWLFLFFRSINGDDPDSISVNKMRKPHNKRPPLEC